MLFSAFSVVGFRMFSARSFFSRSFFSDSVGVCASRTSTFVCATAFSFEARAPSSATFSFHTAVPTLFCPHVQRISFLSLATLHEPSQEQTVLHKRLAARHRQDDEQFFISQEHTGRTKKAILRLEHLDQSGFMAYKSVRKSKH